METTETTPKKLDAPVTVTFYELKTGDTMYAPETFQTPEEAESYGLENYRNRNKGDEHDEYWQKRPLTIRKITKTIEEVKHI